MHTRKTGKDSGYDRGVAPVAYQDILEPGIGQFREFESPRVHSRINSWGLFLSHKLTCGKRESVRQQHSRKNRRAVRLLNPMRDITQRQEPGGRRDDTCDRGLSRSWKVDVFEKKNKKTRGVGPFWVLWRPVRFAVTRVTLASNPPLFSFAVSYYLLYRFCNLKNRSAVVYGKLRCDQTKVAYVKPFLLSARYRVSRASDLNPVGSRHGGMIEYD